MRSVSKPKVWLLSVMRVNLAERIFENAKPEAYSTRELAQEAMRKIIDDEVEAFGAEPLGFDDFMDVKHEESTVHLSEDSWCEVRIDEALVDETI